MHLITSGIELIDALQSAGMREGGVDGSAGFHMIDLPYDLVHCLTPCVLLTLRLQHNDY